jgi:hypothetical protein
MTLRGKGNTLIAFITAYCACNASFDTAGDSTAYQQQYQSILSFYNDHNIASAPDPHRQFMLDLQAWIKKLVRDGHAKVLSLDSNKDIKKIMGITIPWITSMVPWSGHLNIMAA